MHVCGFRASRGGGAWQTKGAGGDPWMMVSDAAAVEENKAGSATAQPQARPPDVIDKLALLYL